MLSDHLNKPELQATNLTDIPLFSARFIGRRIGINWQWKQLTFEVYSGERIAIVGPSGSGKTLLLRILAGLDPLDAGKIIFAQRAMSSWYMPDYRSKVVYLAQRPALIEGTVEDNFTAIYKLKIHSNKSYNHHDVLSNLENLGRDQTFLKQPAIGLSGGETQIVALVRALQIEPQILLLDEPTASLDRATALKTEALLQKWLNAKPGRACIWISHDPNQLARVTDRQIVLRKDGDGGVGNL
jgi:putative ABC transport system ATP-binding protein